MTPEQDKAVLAKWDELGKKQDSNFDITKDVNYAYLFHHFSDEDQDEAWELIPEHKEVRQRIQELLEGQRQPDEIGGGIPMYVLPSNKNTVSDETALKMVCSYMKNTLEHVDKEYMSEELLEALQKCQCEIYNKEKHSDVEFQDNMICEVWELREELTEEDFPNCSSYYALHEYVVYLTKDDDVTNYIMTPTFKKEYRELDFFKTGFQMYLLGISVRIADDGRILVFNNSNE